MQAVNADLRIWRSLPSRFSMIGMAILAGVHAVPVGLIVGAVLYFVLCVVRRQYSWIPARATWGFATIVFVPLSRILYWLSLAFLLFGLWSRGINPLWGLPLIVGWRLAILGLDRTKLSLS